LPLFYFVDPIQVSLIKTRLVGNVSHELRTPLHGILCTTEQLLDPSHGMRPADLAMIATIAECGRTQLQMVERLLEFSALELRDGQGQGPLEPVPLPELMREVEAVTRSLCQAKDLKLLLSTDNVLCMLDRLAVKQVMLNLLGNGIKYTDEGWVSCEVRISQESKLHVVVADSGIGIPEDQLEKIFLPFYQGRSKSQDAGVGLGLAITKTQVAAMGGTIVAKRQDFGSLFEVDIPTIVLQNPCKEASPFVAPAPTAACVAANRATHQKTLKPSLLLDRACRVLVIDDVPLNRILLKRSLSKLMPNAVVTEAEDGYCALKFMEGANRFDLIFCDWLMPVVSGEEVAWLLRKREEAGLLRRTPLICLSAAVSVESRISMVKCGMDAILRKPFTRENLKNCVSDLLKEDDDATESYDKDHENRNRGVNKTKKL
jgi:CheY-like chemotaxis protein